LVELLKNVMLVFVKILSAVVVMGGIFFLAYLADKKTDTQPTIDASAIQQPKTKNVYEKLNNKEPIQALIVGDSIGESDGADSEKNKWFNKLEEQLRKDFNIYSDFDLVATPGGTAFGGWIDYQTAKKPYERPYDLVVLCFGQNDQGGSVELFGANYEALVREIKTDYPLAEIITLTESSLSQEPFATTIEDVSEHYGLLNVDTRIAFKASGKPYASLAPDGTHPNTEGYKYYTQSVYDGLKSRLTATDIIQPLIEETLYNETNLFKDGQRQSNWENVNGFTVIDGIAIGKAGSTMEHKFEGNLLGIEVWADTNGDKFNVYVDGKLIGGSSNSNTFKINWDRHISHTLSEGQHVVKIEVPSSDKKDLEVKIASIITNKS
jgi:lysophospholipase L1-like esterase